MVNPKLPSDFSKKISEALGLSDESVGKLFNVEEDKAGFFVARLNPKQFLEKDQFKTMCALARDLGGEGYVEGAKAWKVPGPFAKKPSEVTPVGRAMDFLASHKAPDDAVPREPLPFAPVSVTLDKSKPLFFMLPVKGLLSMPFQSRKNIEGPGFEELVESIRSVGVLHPIVVRQKASLAFEIVAGERRVAACKRLGIAEIPATVKKLSDQEAYEVQLVENVQREDLSDMEKARFLDMMIRQFGYTQEALAKKLGKSQPWVSQHLQMLKLDYHPGDNVEIGKITEKQAREILAAPEEKREEILDKINETGEVPTSREIHEIAHPDEKPKTIPCARCGEATSVPVNLGSKSEPKFYCGECAEAVVAEARSGHGPSIEPGRGAEEVEEGEEVEVEEREEAEKIEKKTSDREEQLKAIQIGEFECTECHQHFIVDHLPNGKHKLILLTEVKK